VVDEQEVSGGDILREAREGRPDELLRAEHVFRRDREDVADGELVRAVGELAEADLGALEVDEDGDGLPGVRGRAPHVRVHLLVHRMRTVAEVHAGDVDAGIDDGTQVLITRRGGTQGRDDLGSSHFSFSVSGVVVVGHAVAARAFAQSPIPRSEGRTGAGSWVSPSRKRSTAAATARPSAIAHTMSDWPRPASPATNTPGSGVA